MSSARANTAEREAHMSDPSADAQFEDIVIASVTRSGKGWEIKRHDGWIFFVPENPVTPTPGMTARFYGRGIGYPVRGLALNGRTVFYRTADEEEDFRANEMYGATVDDLLAKWDRGESIWTIERGGLSPGYEQCIQIMAVEFARVGKGMPRTDDDTADYAAFGALCDAALKPIDGALGGVSGAQYGAAKWLAWQWCFNGGPRKLIERAKAKGIDAMQCSRHFPKAPTPPSPATNSAGAALLRAGDAGQME